MKNWTSRKLTELISIVLILFSTWQPIVLAAPAVAEKQVSKTGTVTKSGAKGASPKNAGSNLPVKSGSSQNAAKQSSLTPVLSKPKAGSKICLWKVSSESGAVLYLLGTIHIFKQEYYPLPVEMENAFQKARALLLEIDMSKQDKTKTQMLIREKGLYGAGDNLSQHIKPDTFAMLQQYCQKNSVPMENIMRMKPWLAGLTIMQLELQRLGYSMNAGIDLHFMNEALAAGKKVIGIETEEFQLGLFASFSQDLQDSLLKLTLIDLSKLKDDAGEIMTTWNSGDDSAMEDVLNKSVREHPELAPVQEKLLYERNETMAEKLSLYLKGASGDVYLAAIGTGHLVGSRSVVEALAKRGFKVKQILVGEDI